ncbi:MAG: biotin/lipoyl-containing protein [Pseudoruminococcus massiliensis]|jgi:biotin carboxyl carrier protein|uniref:biotin/lipoyl-containing protein n=1 Tax=Pseudoruminococcus massiliensis TaxID=2086583 RepID=UPI003993E433|nr:biotin/lipoyl-binding protein [Oscillospiraceae bacterium]
MKNLKITVNGVAYDVQVEEVGGSASAPVAAPATPVAPAPKAAPAAAPTSGEPLKCPMPGTIISVNVSAGQQVKLGDVVVVLEAMKMENEIKAPKDGTITSVNVNKGDAVESGTLLVTIG